MHWQLHMCACMHTCSPSSNSSAHDFAAPHTYVPPSLDPHVTPLMGLCPSRAAISPCTHLSAAPVFVSLAQPHNTKLHTQPHSHTATHPPPPPHAMHTLPHTQHTPDTHNSAHLCVLDIGEGDADEHHAARLGVRKINPLGRLRLGGAPERGVGCGGGALSSGEWRALPCAAGPSSGSLHLAAALGHEQLTLPIRHGLFFTRHCSQSMPSHHQSQQHTHGPRGSALCRGHLQALPAFPSLPHTPPHLAAAHRHKQRAPPVRHGLLELRHRAVKAAPRLLRLHHHLLQLAQLLPHAGGLAKGVRGGGVRGEG